jgi:3-oxoacyl-[acyl-carrier protein] reductase
LWSLEIVRNFATEGHEVHVLTRHGVTLFQENNNIDFHPFDLCDAQVKQKAESIFKGIGNIDILINNAGYLVNKAFLEITKEDFQRSYQVNVIGIMQSVQAAVPYMLHQGGHIVNISSVGGFQGSVKFAGLTAYSTSKAALCSFTELFSEEYKDTKISMNCLCLGAVQTEMLEAAFPGYEAPTKPDEMAAYICDFSKNAHQYFRGKILPVSISTP